jgi:hypothetical protein
MAPQNKRINSALERAAAIVVAAQETNGGFASLSAPDVKFNNPLVYRTTFFASLILSCLNMVDSKEAVFVKQKIVHFLLSQKSDRWSFNYWQKEASEARTSPYPDDLDDTFCALSALAGYDHSLISGGALARIIDLLTLTERQPGGPYRTWLVGPDAAAVWQDYDAAVNANVAYFLALQKVRVPGLDAFLDSKIKQQDFRSPYYPSVYPVVYFLSRAMAETNTQGLVKYLLAQTRGNNPLEVALQVSSLVRQGAGQHAQTGVEYILDTQQPDGAWGIFPFCNDPSVNRENHVAAAPALTAAFCMEALALYRNMVMRSSGTLPISSTIHDNIVSQTRKRFQGLSEPLRATGEEVLQKTLDKDRTHSITSLPSWFHQAMGKAGHDIAETLVMNLGQANLYGWMAYTIYDDVLDGQPQHALLPLANLCLREVVKIYEGLNGFAKFFHGVMDNLENANTWEVAQARDPAVLPDYGDLRQLADRSFGHALGPLALMHHAGYQEGSPEFDGIKKFFVHYLIARQLNDDAHDWQDDLGRGQVNAVAVLVMRKQQKNNPGQVPGKMESILPQLQKLFWDTAIYDICNLIDEHLAQAKIALAGVTLLEQTDLLLSMLRPLESAVSTARSETARARDFLRVYKG